MKGFQNDVRLARKGDTEAFSRLYSIVYKDMYHAALYNLRNQHDAYDIVSEAVIDAFSTIGKLKNEEAIDKITFSEFDFESSELKEALDNLDDESRGILSLSVLGGYTSEEIAKIYGIKASTIRSKLSRIKNELRLSLTL